MHVNYLHIHKQDNRLQQNDLIKILHKENKTIVEPQVLLNIHWTKVLKIFLVQLQSVLWLLFVQNNQMILKTNHKSRNEEHDIYHRFVAELVFLQGL
jgi:hypothetical protein